MAEPSREPCRSHRSARPVNRQCAYPPAAKARPTASRKAAPTLAISAAPVYHPLFLFNQFGDVERCALRRGNVLSADGRRTVLGSRPSTPVIV
jgi:hypothetical protein